jgi:hypothetical protein
MPQFKVAHLREQGQDMVIVPVSSAFGSQPSDEQDAVISDLQRHSMAAGLRGTVVPVWKSGGRFHFIAPRQWHPFFASLSMRHVAANINRMLSW